MTVLAIPFRKNRHLLFEGASWRVVLNPNQVYLGRSIVFLTTREIDDPLDLTREERDELWDETLPRLIGALGAAFAPDRINYSHLANKVNHCHWHIVPRYESPPTREFAGWTFVDPKPGRPYSQAPKKLKPPAELLEPIWAELRRHV
jgi:diadenosine tetraphosphate (Ap4A) HIT family hydrolase